MKISRIKGEGNMLSIEEKKELVNKLLSISGNEVEVPDDVNENILKFGHLMENDVIVVPGGTSRLYMNQQEEQKIRVASGFALEEDGTWRIRAWLVLEKNGYKIIDNKKAEKYYGVVMPY